MTAHHPSRPTKTSPQVAKKAALIANFYGKRGQMQSLLNGLIQSLALIPDDQNTSYVNPTTRTYLRSVDPPALSAQDTTILQLALNRAGVVETAWETMRTQLEAIVPADEVLKQVWGYTLIYQAELTEQVPLLEALVALLPDVQRLHPTQSQSPQVLVKADFAGGWLWLIDLPQEGDGLQAATVYLALSQPNTENRLVREVLYNPVAAFLMADLIAHKGYHQIRQYRIGNLDEQYRDKMQTLSRHTDLLLHDLTHVSVKASEVDTLASKYGMLVSAVVHLDQLRVSLIRQVFNFAWWGKQAGENEITSFHHQHLQEAAQELELLVAQGQHPLGAARTAVEMIRTRLDKQQEDQQQRIGVLLTIVAVVLSALVLMDKENARAVLELLGIAQPIGIFPVLGVQGVFLIIFWLLIRLVIWRLKFRRSKKPRS